MNSADWERRLADAWASLDDRSEAEFLALIERLAAELPSDSAIAAFERACSFDSTGHPDRAVPLYRRALEIGLTGERRRRAIIQLASSLRNLGEPQESVTLLTAEMDADSDHLDDAVRATLALALTDVGREREAVSLAIEALAPHLPRYQRSMANYARLLLEAGAGSQAASREDEPARSPTLHPAIQPLAALAGQWEMTASVSGQDMGRGRTTFEWLEDGRFLVQHANASATSAAPPEWVSNTPFPVTTVTGLDDSAGRFSVLYADARGVFRVYQMTLVGRSWTMWREAPDFHQRFIATISDDGKTIAGRWEASPDGSEWAADFEMRYDRIG